MNKEQGHGDHWNTITDGVESFMEENLADIIAKGKPQEIVDVKLKRRKNPKQILSLLSGEDDIKALVLNEVKKDKVILSSLYPYSDKGTVVELDLEYINEWSNGYETTLDVSTPSEGVCFGFFDTMYFKNKDKYKKGKRYKFMLSALAYNCGSAQQESITLDEETSNKLANDFNKVNGNQEECEELEKPITLDMSNLVALFPCSMDYPDDLQFVSPVSNVKLSSFAGMDLYKMNIYISRDEEPKEIKIPLYAKQSFFTREPKTNESISGVMWIFGHLVE